MKLNLKIMMLTLAAAGAMFASCDQDDDWAPATNPNKGLENGHEWVQLWKNGPKWATCNVGAAKPEQTGYYLAWGECAPKSEYTMMNYKWNKDGQDEGDVNFTKYNNDKTWGEVIDNQLTLLPEDDAATVVMGGKWRTPTVAECDTIRLKEYCQWTWMENYNGTGVNGYVVRGVTPGYTDSSIFLPACGNIWHEVTGYNEGGFYLSSDLQSDVCTTAQGFSFDKGLNYMYYVLRENGTSVRGCFR